MAKERADSQGYWPEMFKAKAHTGLTQDQQEQQLWRFPAQWEHDCVVFSLQTELTFIYNYHSSFFFFLLNKHVSKTWKCNTTADIYSTQTYIIRLLHRNSKAYK